MCRHSTVAHGIGCFWPARYLTLGVSSGQVSDALTSHMARPQFERACELLGLPPQSDDCWTGLCQQQQRDEGRPIDRHSLRTLHAIACLVYTLGAGFV